MHKYASLFIALLGVACVGAGFQLRYYGVAPNKDNELKGTLLAKDPKDDVDLFEKCHPDAQIKGKCWVIFTEEKERAENYIKYLEIQLKECQK